MVTVFYSSDYTASAHSFDTTRKASWVSESLATCPIPGIAIKSPAPLTGEQVTAHHHAEYVEAVRTGEPRRLAESQGFSWDPQFWPMVLASNGGALDAAREALRNGRSGSLTSGLHHARRRRGAGFCTFNGLAIAAKTVLDEGAKAVLILDLDAHCGGGTYDMIKDDPRIWQTDVSVDTFDRYIPGENSTLDLVKNAGDYLPTIRARFSELNARGAAFDLCLYNAGMDPFEGCTIGGLSGINMTLLAERERLVFDWCARRKTPVAFVLAGGYIGGTLDRTGLVDLHRLTLSAAARAV